MIMLIAKRHLYMHEERQSLLNKYFVHSLSKKKWIHQNKDIDGQIKTKKNLGGFYLSKYTDILKLVRMG